MNAYWQNKLAQLVCAIIGIYAASLLVTKFAPTLRWEVPDREVPVEFSTNVQAGDKAEGKSPEQRLSSSVTRFPVDFPTPTTADIGLQETPLPLSDDKALPDRVAPLNPVEALPVPPTIGHYPEERYGETLVFQVTVNEHNLVVDSELKVPSFDALHDITMVTGAFGQRLENVFPPIAKGELRKIDIRMGRTNPYKNPEEIIEQQKRLQEGLPPLEKFVPPELLLP